MTNSPNPNDAKATVPLPGTAPQPERERLPLPGSDGDGQSTVPLAGDVSAPFPLDGTGTRVLPATIGRFAVRAWLGSGAFGDVYRAHDPQLDREVALKVAKPGSLDTPERLARFLREAKSAANLRHPNIVPLYETGRDGERLFIASAFIDGRTLEAVIQEANDKGEPIPLDTAAQIARKLAYAHSQGIVHRDVKPANVMVDAAGEPHLLDFGLAARTEDGAERLTQDGQGMGTPAYMAPEQADGHGVAVSDQYSLGCTLYELLTGQTPFAGGPAQQLFLHKTQPVPSPRKSRREVPRDLDRVVLKCVEKEPARRYGSCADLAEDLRRFLAREPVRARRIGPVERLARWAKRNPVVASSVSFGVLALLIGTVVALAQRDEALWQARQAKTAAENEVAQKKLADDKADLATKEAKRANDNKKLADDETIKANARTDEAKFEARKAKDAKHGIQIEQGLTAWERRDYQGTLNALNAMEPEYVATWETVHLRNLWLRCNQPLRDFVGHTDLVSSACFSPDGTRILTGSLDKTAKVWDAATGQVKLTLKGHTAEVNSACFSPDGKWIVTGSYRTAKVWDVPLYALAPPPRPVNR